MRCADFRELATLRQSVLLTAVGNTVLVVSWVPDIYLSPYAQVLVAKVCLVRMMIGLALFNRYILLSRLALAGARYWCGPARLRTV